MFPIDVKCAILVEVGRCFIDSEFEFRISGERFKLIPKIILPISYEEQDALLNLKTNYNNVMGEKEARQERTLQEVVDKLVQNNVNVVICQKGVDELAQYYMAKQGIFALRRVSKDDMEKIARATQGKVINSVKDLTTEVLGQASLVEEPHILALL